MAWLAAGVCWWATSVAAAAVVVVVVVVVVADVASHWCCWVSRDGACWRRLSDVRWPACSPVADGSAPIEYLQLNTVKNTNLSAILASH